MFKMFDFYKVGVKKMTLCTYAYIMYNKSCASFLRLQFIKLKDNYFSDDYQETFRSFFEIFCTDKVFTSEL